MTSRKNIKIFYFNRVNVGNHWHVAGWGISHLWLPCYSCDWFFFTCWLIWMKGYLGWKIGPCLWSKGPRSTQIVYLLWLTTLKLKENFSFLFSFWITMIFLWIHFQEKKKKLKYNFFFWILFIIKFLWIYIQGN